MLVEENFSSAMSYKQYMRTILSSTFALDLMELSSLITHILQVCFTRSIEQSYLRHGTLIIRA